MDYLKEMIEDLVNENNDNAKVNFHSYLQGRISNLTESYNDFCQAQAVILNTPTNGTNDGNVIVDDVYDKNSDDTP